MGKNIGKGGYEDNMIGSDDDGSDDNAHDPYMMRLKAQAAEEDAGDDDDEDESEDEDFQPEMDVNHGQEVAEEFDSEANSSSDEEGGSDGDDGSGGEERKRPKKKEKKEKKKKAVERKRPRRIPTHRRDRCRHTWRG